jgi:hypothetical protein
VYNPDGSKRTPDSVEVARGLLEHYRQLIRIRNASRALQVGKFETILTDDRKDIFAFSRSLPDEQVVVVLNNSGAVVTADLPGVSPGPWHDMLNGTEHSFTPEQRQIRLQPKWGAILMRGRGPSTIRR